MVDEEVAGADRGELLPGRLHRVPRRPGDRHPGIVLEIRPVEPVELAEIGQVEHPVERVDELVGNAQPLLDLLQHRRGHRLRHLEPRHLAETRAQELKLDGLQQVVGLVGHLEIAVARHAEERPLEDLHPGEQLGQVVGEDSLERHEAAPAADGEEARQALRHLDPGEALLAGLGVGHEEAEADRERGDVGKRLAGPDGQRRQYGEDLALEAVVELCELLRLELLDARDDDPLLGQRRAELVPPQLGLARVQIEHALASVVECLLRRPAVGQAPAHAGFGLAGQPGDADHEELVQHLGRDLEEEDTLEQRQGLVARQLEQASVVLEEGELAIDQPIGGGRGALTGASGGRHCASLPPARKEDRPAPATRAGAGLRSS